MPRALLRRPNALVYPGVRPGFDPSHVAAVNARASVVSAGLNLTNLLNGQTGTRSGSTAISSAVLGSIGPSTFFGTSADNITFSVATNPNQGPQTFAGFVQFSAVTGSNQRILKNDGSSFVTVWLTTSGTWGVFHGAGGPTWDSGIAAAANTPYFFVVSVLGTPSGTVQNILVLNLKNGSVVTASNSSATTMVGLSVSQFVLTEAGSTTDAYLAASMLSACYLSIPQMLQWAKDPWSFWYPPKFDFTQMLKAPAGGGIVNTLSAAVGAFAMSGKAATPNAARSLSAAQGSFSLSGKAATLNRGIQMSATTGAFTVNGIAASFPRARTMAAAQGAFTVSGIAAGLFRGRTINAAQGSFALNGVSASFPLALSIKPVTGVFSVNGGAAVLTKTPAGGAGAVSHSNPFFSTPGPGMAIP